MTERVRLRDPAVFARAFDSGGIEAVLGDDAPGGGAHRRPHRRPHRCPGRRRGATVRPAVACPIGAARVRARGPLAFGVDAGDDLLAQPRLPLREHDLGDIAAMRGGHLEHHLVGLDLDEDVSALDPIAGPEVPGEELRVGD